MKFYSGFTFKNDENYFKEYINHSEYSVSGFSYGAIKAFKKVQEELALGNRVDRLILLSPAFFQTKSIKFKKLQLIGYKRDKASYIKQFLHSCFSPYDEKKVRTKDTTIEELDELLSYEWILDNLKFVEDNGVKIEIYLGSEDKIIDVAGARELFLEVGTVTYIKGANHFLCVN